MSKPSQCTPDPLPNPIFYEALAAAAKCEPADAYDHFHSLRGPLAHNHRVEKFLEDYAGTGEQYGDTK